MMTRLHAFPWGGFLLACLLCGASSAHAAQAVFTSGSDGSDGPLDLSAVSSGTTVVFDPRVFRNAQGAELDPQARNVYNFTTITIPAGVTLKLRAYSLRTPGPAYFLAQGDVDIEGTIDLSGAPGHPGSSPPNYAPAEPGPGGFPGGLGTTNVNIIQSPQPGIGPGGGAVSGTTGPCDVNGNFALGNHRYGNLFLLPLIGGSGGAGNGPISGVGNGGGGAGGGALLLASSTTITINGSIVANGGMCGDQFIGRGCGGGLAQNYNDWRSAGAGSGGAIRLMAPTITGSGSLSAQDPLGDSCTYGFIRREDTEDNFTGTITGGVSTRASLQAGPILGLPGGTSAGTGFPTLNVIGIGGQSVPASPLGSFTNPDVSVNSSQPLQIDLAGSNVPVGTTILVTVYNQSTGMQTVTTTLSGTVAASTATVSVALPPGVSQIYASASWAN